MRIAHVAESNLADGAVGKINGQAAAWQAQGNDTRVFALSHASRVNIVPVSRRRALRTVASRYGPS